MGSEQSHQQGTIGINGQQGRTTVGQSSSSASRLQRGNTIAVSEIKKRTSQDDSSSYSGSRPASPPISVCSDSDLPYISYTDRPIGDSPKIRNKGSVVIGSRSIRSNSISSSTNSSRRQISIKARQQQNSTSSHNIVVVKSGTRDQSLDKDPDIQRLQNIPMFLPVMRGTLSLPSSRDPEILERLPSVHLQNICSRMQVHFNVCANQVAADQVRIMTKIKEIDQHVNKLSAAYTEKQKAYINYSEQFSKIRSISQQLTRCNSIIIQNIDSLETLNNMLPIEDRLEPFVWKTE